MIHESSDNKLSYQGDTDQGASIYEMVLAGKPVFDVKVSKDEPGMPIYIKRSGTIGNWTKTASRAFPVEDGSRISAISMKEAVYGNLVFLLADLLAAK